MDYLEALHQSLLTRYEKLADLHSKSTDSLRLPSPPRDEPRERSLGSKSNDDSTKPVDPSNNSKPTVPVDDSWISVEELANLIKRRSSSSVKLLIFDIRPMADFTACQLKTQQVIHCPADVYLNRSTTFSHFSSELSKGPYKAMWDARGLADPIVFIDHSTGISTGEVEQRKSVPETLPHSHPLLLLRDMLIKWDAKKVVRMQPRVLAGGIRDFVLRYAPLTTNPGYRVNVAHPGPMNRASSRTLPNADLVDYPDLLLSDLDSKETIDFPDLKEQDAPTQPLSDQPTNYEQEATDSNASDKQTRNRIDQSDLDDRLRQLRVMKPSTVVPSNLPSDSSHIPGEGDRRINLPKIDRQLKPIAPMPSSSFMPSSTTPRTASISEDADDREHQPLPTETSVSKQPTNSSSPGDGGTNGCQSRQAEQPHGKNGSPARSHNGQPKDSPIKSDLSSESNQPKQPIVSVVDTVSPSPPRRPPPPSLAFPTCHTRPTGLRNLGNTCYMNAVLQSLAHTRALAFFYLHGLNDGFVNPSNPLGYGGAVSSQFQNLYTSLWSKSDCFDDLHQFKRVVGEACNTFAGTEQQDSLEFLIFILDALHEEMNEGTRTPSVMEDTEQDEEHLDPNERASRAWNDYQQRNKSVIVTSFQGQLLSSIQCCVCPKRSTKFDTFMYLSLPLPSYSSTTLQECVQLFGNPEKIVASYQCTRCRRYTDATKRLTLWRLPTYLVIHLKRFHYEDNNWKKSTTYVRFPIDHFELQAKKSNYALYAVVNHYGTLEGGHYTAFCRGISDGAWYEYDDSRCKQIPDSAVQPSANAVDVFRVSPYARPVVSSKDSMLDYQS